MSAYSRPGLIPYVRKMDLAQVKTVLGVWAHPDDEAYLSSGLMARAVEAGARVVCVTATRGEGGSLDPVLWPPETLGEVREVELMRSLAHLGVTEHVFLDMPDVDWDTSLPDSGFTAVREIMADLDPDMVLTFGPDGMTGHEGHKSVSDWTTTAFAEVARPEAGLFHAVVSETWATEFVPLIEPHGVYREGAQIPIVPDDEIDLDVATRRARDRAQDDRVEGAPQSVGRSGAGLRRGHPGQGVQHREVLSAQSLIRLALPLHSCAELCAGTHNSAHRRDVLRELCFALFQRDCAK